MKESEIIVINEKEYICFKTIEDNGNKYVYLISNFKPAEIKFAKELDDERLEIINDKSEKEYVSSLLEE